METSGMHKFQPILGKFDLNVSTPNRAEEPLLAVSMVSGFCICNPLRRRMRTAVILEYNRARLVGHLYGQPSVSNGGRVCVCKNVFRNRTCVNSTARRYRPWQRRSVQYSSSERTTKQQLQGGMHAHLLCPSQLYLQREARLAYAGPPLAYHHHVQTWRRRIL